MPRWLAVSLGCVTALGMQALFVGFAAQLGGANSPVLGYCALFVALGLAGYVTGHLVGGRLPVLYAALTAIVFILFTATFQATREVIVARQIGIGALPPIDFLQLTLSDVLAMSGASVGGWLAARF